MLTQQRKAGLCHLHSHVHVWLPTSNVCKSNLQTHVCLFCDLKSTQMAKFNQKAGNPAKKATSFKKTLKKQMISKEKAIKKKQALLEVENQSESEIDDNASDISFNISDADNITDSENEAEIDKSAVEEADDSADEDAESDNDEAVDADSGSEEEVDHKKALERLKETDPEFYQYLQDNDKKLLQFNLSDDEDDSKEGDDDEDAVHKPSGELEVASDESDFEPDDEDNKKVDDKLITLKLLKQWQKDLQTDNSNRTLSCLVKAFHAALRRVSNEEDDDEPVQYKVDGSSVFNAVIQLCVLELGPAVRKFLGLKSGSKLPPHKCKKFVKVKNILKSYFSDLLKLLGGVTSINILNVLLKHLHYISPMIISFPNLIKPLLKKLVHLWSTSDESVRVVSFLCILRITHNQQQNLLDSVLRMMYMAYVKNSKFVSVNTLPGINFMRRSLVEMYALDVNVSYQHVFLFIRQLAINLRNAITVNKKENIQTVYNWQFVNSLRLWGNLLSVTCNKQQLQPLVYPFVQVCLGTIKLVATAQYYPLRFHVVQILIDLSRDTGVFIPVLPFILEVLTTYDFNKKNQKVSMKPLHFTSLLRLSKSQMTENGFKDTVIETIYGQLLEYMAAQSQSIAFPDLALTCKLQLKAFTKKCNTAAYQRKISQILEKIEQTSQFIIQERKKVTFNLTETSHIDAWETTIKNKGTPISTFYTAWNKMRNIKKSKQATNNEALGEYNLPTLKKRTGPPKESSGEVVLFPSDSEDDEDGPVVKKPKRGKRGGKNNNKKPYMQQDMNDVNGDDVVEDLKISDW